MYRISELAERVGLSRTALLYYEKIGLIAGRRESNGYRSYSEYDVERIKLVQQLQLGGLTLAECKVCLDDKIDIPLLRERLHTLTVELEQKQKAKLLLEGLLGESSLSDWHQHLEQIAPNAHRDWLLKQGFSDKDAQYIKWLSKDMNKHDIYMADFNRVFSGLERWGPGSEKDTLKALKRLPKPPARVLEIGAGRGIATLPLLRHCDAHITAVDNHPDAIAGLKGNLERAQLSDRVSIVDANMMALPFESQSFDVIWAEGCAYIMGVDNALKQWRRLLPPGGFLVLSDIVWRAEHPSQLNQEFWQNEYPSMSDVSTIEQQARAAGYQVIDHFALSEQAWQGYYQPLAKRLADLQPELGERDAYYDMQRELASFAERNNEYDYQMFLLQKTDAQD